MGVQCEQLQKEAHEEQEQSLLLVSSFLFFSFFLLVGEGLVALLQLLGLQFSNAAVVKHGRGIHPWMVAVKQFCCIFALG